MLGEQVLQDLYREHGILMALLNEVTDPEVIDRLILRLAANEQATAALRAYHDITKGMTIEYDLMAGRQNKTA